MMATGDWRQRIEALILAHADPEDRGHELANLRYGGARRWLLERVDIPPRARILEVGYGQGYLTVEIANNVTGGLIVGIDLLQDDVTTRATRWLARHASAADRVRLVRCNAERLPFRNGAFQASLSFVALQDIALARGTDAVLATVREACRALAEGGVLAFADDMFPSSRPQGSQGDLFDAILRYLGTRLPAEEEIVLAMERYGLRDIRIERFDSNERLRPEDAARELRRAAGDVALLGRKADFEQFWREAGDIILREGRAYARVVAIIGHM